MSSSVRILYRHRGYVAFAITTLAAAVGINLVIFTMVNALWLRPLPFPEADRVVIVTRDVGGPGEPVAFSGIDGPIWKAFDAVAGQVITSEHASGLLPHLTFDRVGRQVDTLGVTPGYFNLLGLSIRGRDFAQDDDRPGAEPVAIISDRLWSKVFGRQPEVIGAVEAAKPFPIRIVGVAPAEFDGARRGEQIDVWIPSNLVLRVAPEAGASALPDGTALPLMVLARLYRGQTTTEVGRHLVQESVDARDQELTKNLALVPLKSVFGTPESRTIIVREVGPLTVVAALAALVLFAGCATLMALVLVHYECRRRDLALSIALGASRRRLVFELARELCLLALGGSIGALLVAAWSLRVIPSLALPGGVDLGRLDLSIDWRVVGTAVVTTILTLVAAAWLPVSRFTQPDFAGELLTGSTTTTSASSQRVRQALLATHVCTTIILLVAAGLFVRAVVHGFGSGPGFDADHLVFVKSAVVSPRDDSLSLDSQRQAMAVRTARLADALQSLPGVDLVASGIPPIGSDSTSFLLAPTMTETSLGRREILLGTMVGSPELLQALGVPILSGRGLTETDMTAKPAPAVVSASLARMLWPARDPVGEVVSLGARVGRCVIVGVSRDFVFGSFARPAAGVVTTARLGGFGSEPQFAIHTARPETLREPIRKVVNAAVPDVPWIKVATGREIIANDLGRQRLGAWFFSGFGLTALLLGIGGVFGLVAHLAQSRQREFGVRVALGAAPRNLVWSALVAALGPVLIGVVTGLCIAALVARVFSSFLTGLNPMDPPTYIAVAIALLVCAALAGLAAAWQLRRTAPIDALRTN